MRVSENSPIVGIYVELTVSGESNKGYIRDMGTLYSQVRRGRDGDNYRDLGKDGLSYCG